MRTRIVWLLAALSTPAWIAPSLGAAEPPSAVPSVDSAVRTAPRAPCTRCGQSDCAYVVGINLAGAEFAGGRLPGEENRHFRWPSEAALDYWQGVGVRLVRLPFKWERLQPALSAEFDPTYQAGLVRSIRWMAARGMAVVPDMHNYAKYRGKNIGTDEVPADAFADAWRRLAVLLKDEPNIWAYGLMNEPNAGVDWPGLAQLAIDAVRAVDGRTTILVANDYAGWAATHQKGNLADWAEDSLRIGNPALLRDPSGNLRFELHTYLDHDNSGLYRNAYGHEAMRTDGPGARVSPDVGVARIRPFAEWLARHGAKGFVGEYGAPANPQDDARWLVALENTMAFLRGQCLPSTIWAAGEMWTPGMGYVVERRGWSRDLPEDLRLRDRPQTLLLRKHMEPPRLDAEGERQLREHIARYAPRQAPRETADGFRLVDAFEGLGVRKTSIFHLSKDWHRTWAGDSQFHPDQDGDTYLPVLRTPEDQWGHETFFRNPLKFAIPIDAATATLYLKVKLPEVRTQDVTIGLASELDAKRANKPEETHVAAVKVTAGAIRVMSRQDDTVAWVDTGVTPQPGQWIGVWFVVDRANGRYDVLLDPGARCATVGGSAASATLRAAAGDIDRVVLATHGKGAAFVTDLYVDSSKANPNQPNPLP